MKDLKLLGLKCRDCITGFSGIVTSVSFDLYGCIQAWVDPQEITTDTKGKWFDVKRLGIIDQTPVMMQPDFVDVPGPAEKGAPYNS